MAEQRNEWFDWLKAILFALGLALVVRMFLFSPIVVDGPSMMPTLHDQDQMIVNKIAYKIGEPERFDIVVFHASEQKDFIKRVIGLPGEHVEVKNEVLYINGKQVNEPFIDELKQNKKPYQTLTSDFTLEDLPGEFEKIPEGHVLVLGDNRSNSTDSRMLGVISMEQIVGKASLIYWPLERFQIAGE